MSYQSKLRELRWGATLLTLILSCLASLAADEALPPASRRVTDSVPLAGRATFVTVSRGEKDWQLAVSIYNPAGVPPVRYAEISLRVTNEADQAVAVEKLFPEMGTYIGVTGKGHATAAVGLYKFQLGGNHELKRIVVERDGHSVTYNVPMDWSYSLGTP